MADQVSLTELRAKMDAITSGAEKRRRPSKSQTSGLRAVKPDDAGTFDDTADAAFKRIIAILNAADKSEKALRERLAKAGFSEGSIEPALERAKECGFVCDDRFARLLIQSRISQGKGSAGIERELLEHGIEPSTIEGWPEDFDVDHETELERALALLARKPPRSKNVRDGAYRKLMQKGFSSSVSSTAARMYSENSA